MSQDPSEGRLGPRFPRVPGRCRRQRDTIVVGLWRRPGADVVDPRRRHRRPADTWYHGDRVSRDGDHDKPRTGGALPERRVEAGEVSDFGFCAHDHGVNIAVGHVTLAFGSSGCELLVGKPSFVLHRWPPSKVLAAAHRLRRWAKNSRLRRNRLQTPSGSGGSLSIGTSET